MVISLSSIVGLEQETPGTDGSAGSDASLVPQKYADYDVLAQQLKDLGFLSDTKLLVEEMDAQIDSVCWPDFKTCHIANIATLPTLLGKYRTLFINSNHSKIRFPSLSQVQKKNRQTSCPAQVHIRLYIV